MSSARVCIRCLAVSFVVLAGAATGAAAQGWGEQAPVQFKYANQGLTAEVYRNQLSASAAAASASARAGGLGYGQSSNQLNNAVQINNNNTYNVTVSGSDNYLNFNGDTVNADQTSSGTTQTSDNSSNTSSSTTNKLHGSSDVLNK